MGRLSPAVGGTFPSIKNSTGSFTPSREDRQHSNHRLEGGPNVAACVWVSVELSLGLRPPKRTQPMPPPSTESSLFRCVVVDLPAEPDGSTAQVGYRRREVVMPAAALPQSRAADSEQLRGLKGTDEIELDRCHLRTLVGCFDRNAVQVLVRAAHHRQHVVACGTRSDPVFALTYAHNAFVQHFCAELTKGRIF